MGFEVPRLQNKLLLPFEVKAGFYVNNVVCSEIPDVASYDLELLILLQLLPRECWDCKCAPPHSSQALIKRGNREVDRVLGRSGRGATAKY